MLPETGDRPRKRGRQGHTARVVAGLPPRPRGGEPGTVLRRLRSNPLAAMAHNGGRGWRVWCRRELAPVRNLEAVHMARRRAASRRHCERSDPTSPGRRLMLSLTPLRTFSAAAGPHEGATPSGRRCHSRFPGGEGDGPQREKHEARFSLEGTEPGARGQEDRAAAAKHVVHKSLTWLCVYWDGW